MDTFYAALFALAMAFVIAVSSFRLGMLHQKKIDHPEDSSGPCVIDMKDYEEVIITSKNPFMLLSKEQRADLESALSKDPWDKA